MTVFINLWSDNTFDKVYRLIQQKLYFTKHHIPLIFYNTILLCTDSLTHQEKDILKVMIETTQPYSQ